MRKRTLAVMAAGVLVCAIGAAWEDQRAAQETVKIDPSAIPAGWDQLRLTGDQQVKITVIRSKTIKLIADLEKQILAVHAKERSELLSVLDGVQRAKLEELIFKLPAKTPNPAAKGGM